MSAETPSWNTGACHASVRRRAIVFRVEVSWTTSTSAGGSRRRRPRRPARARCGRLLDVLGDDPPVRARADDPREVEAALACHTPRERRRLDAPVLGAGRRRTADCAAHGRVGVGCGARGTRLGTLRGGAEPASVGSAAVSGAGVRPTGLERDLFALLADHGDRRPTSTSPSATRIFSSTPSASASTSCVTLSVSSS